MKFFIKDFFSKRDQIRRKLVMKNLIFGAVIMKINSPEVFEFRLSTKNLLAMQNSKLFSFSNLLQM